MPATLGAGAFVFEPDADWCRLPDERPLGNTHGGIVVDAAGLVYYNTDTDRSIMVHRPDGAFEKSLAPRLPALHSMTLRSEDGVEYIYAAHLPGKQVVKLRLDGSLVWALGVPMESGKYDSPDQFNPTAVAVGPDGRIYVADGYGRNWVHIFSPGLRYLKSIGGPGEEPGRFRTCHGLAVDTRGERALLLVCDRENRRLQRFDLDGRFVDVAATDLRRPCAVAFHGDHVAVAELEGRVTILDDDFDVVAHLGNNPDRGQWANNGVPAAKWSPGVFTAPHGVCFDDEGNLYVMDWNATGRISKLVRRE
jgi:DNA-binding beta-propeller fold protein YncE